MRSSPDIEVVRNGADRLGESPCWHVGEQALYWIDALAPAIQRLASDGTHTVWPMSRIVGSFAFRQGGGLIASLQDGFHEVDLVDGSARLIVDPEPEKPDNILNDGKCDRQGRFWCGSRDGALTHPVGALHRLDPDGRVTTVDEGFIVGNGLAFAPDGRTLYFSDSRAETVFAYDLDPDDGAVSNRRVFFSTREVEGRPDGATVDAEGFYWSALVHGGQIARIDPKGRIDRLIALPVKHVTMCTFGGPNLDVLFVTSAASMVSGAERAGVPHAGALFAVHGLGVRGLPEPHFAG